MSVRVPFDIDNPQEAAILVDHREGEQAVECEELARVQHRGRARDGDQLPHHDLTHRLLERIEQQPTGCSGQWGKNRLAGQRRPASRLDKAVQRRVTPTR